MNSGKDNIGGPGFAALAQKVVMWAQEEAEARWSGGGGVMGGISNLLVFLIILQLQPEASKTSENLLSPSAQLSLGPSFVQSHFQAQYR